MAQDRMGAQNLKQFACHRGCEALHTLAGQLHPLRMGSWHAYDAPEAGPERPKSKKRCFLPSHYVFLAAAPLADAGENAWQDACLGHGGNHSSVDQRL